MYSTSLPEIYEAAQEFEMKSILLDLDKFMKKRNSLDQTITKQNRDFLMGNVVQYEGIVEDEFAKLKADLDEVNGRDSNIVLPILSILGNCRWNINDQKDNQLGQNFSYYEQLAQFCKDIASRLKDHPAIIGYNLITEQYPEMTIEEDYAKDSKIKDIAADLNKHYETKVQAIRTVDSDTPILVNIGLDMIPSAFQYIKPIQDNRVLYAFHMYEPYQIISQKQKRGFTYELVTMREKQFHKEMLPAFLKSIEEWRMKHNIPKNRIITEEFGINRMVQSTDHY